MRDWLAEGADPDDLYPPGGRCHGPAYPDSHGCGRFVANGGYMCPRCDAESRAWHNEETAREAAYIAEQVEREDAAYRAAWEAERERHPDTITTCAMCGASDQACTWDGGTYVCADRAACEQRDYSNAASAVPADFWGDLDSPY